MFVYISCNPALLTDAPTVTINRVEQGRHRHHYRKPTRSSLRRLAHLVMAQSHRNPATLLVPNLLGEIGWFAYLDLPLVATKGAAHAAR